MREFFVFLLGLLAISTMASAQGFQVRPLTIEGDVPPGTTVEIPIEILPTTLLESRTLDVQVVQLAQTDSGAFLAIDRVSGSETSRSAAGWITAPAQVALDPPDATILTLTMQVPIAARGNYTAGILLIARPPEDATGLRLTVRVLVPIIVGIQGRVVRQDVRLTDASLRYRFPEPENPAEATPSSDAPPRNDRCPSGDRKQWRHLCALSWRHLG